MNPRRQVDQQAVQRAPGHVGQELPQRRGLERLAPHMALGLRPPEPERPAVLEQQRHREATHAVRTHGGHDGIVVHRAAGNGHVEQGGDRRPVEVGVEHARGTLPAARQGPGEARRHEALAHAPLAAHDGDHAAHPLQPHRHPAPLRRDLVR